MSSLCSLPFDGWTAYWCVRLAFRIPSVCGTRIWYVVYITWTAQHSPHYSPHYYYSGRRSRRVFPVPSICLLRLSCKVERKASSDGFSGMFVLAVAAYTGPNRQLFQRVSSCSCNLYLHRDGVTMKSKCCSAKHSCLIQYGTMPKVISMENNRTWLFKL